MVSMICCVVIHSNDLFRPNTQHDGLAIADSSGAKEANYLLKLRSELSHNQETKDCSLLMDNGEVLDVHTSLLCQVWPSLKDLLLTGENSCICERNVILLPSTKVSTMRKCLDIIYTGRCKVNEVQDIQDVEDLSSRLGLAWAGCLSRESWTIIKDPDNCEAEGEEVLLENERDESLAGKEKDSSDCSSDTDLFDSLASQYVLPTVRYTNPSQLSNTSHLIHKKETVCSLNCQFSCKQSLSTWSQSEMETVQNSFSGLSPAAKQKKLYKQ